MNQTLPRSDPLLRGLLAAARRDGWQHVVYGGSFGTEHVWMRVGLRVTVEPWLDRDGQSTWRLTITRYDGYYADRLVRARVDNVDQVLHLLAAYGITVPVLVDEHGTGHCSDCCAFPGDGPESFAEHDHDMCRDALAEVGG